MKYLEIPTSDEVTEVGKRFEDGESVLQAGIRIDGEFDDLADLHRSFVNCPFIWFHLAGFGLKKIEDGTIYLTKGHPEVDEPEPVQNAPVLLHDENPKTDS